MNSKMSFPTAESYTHEIRPRPTLIYFTPVLLFVVRCCCLCVWCDVVWRRVFDIDRYSMFRVCVWEEVRE